MRELEFLLFMLKSARRKLREQRLCGEVGNEMKMNERLRDTRRMKPSWLVFVLVLGGGFHI